MLNEEGVEKYHENGYVVVPGFLTEEEVDSLKQSCWRIVDKMDPNEHKCIFGAKSRLKNDYFLNSGDKIRFFLESETLNDDGSLKYDKHESLNKIGHALHWLDPDFKKVTFSSKVKGLMKSLKMIDPVIIHSMYIFKPPHIGGEVIPHRDASYLYCDPPDKVVGLWIALEDASLENGCLWFVPGSHTETLDARSVRVNDDDKVTLTNVPAVECDSQRFVAEPVKKGDLIIIHGMVIHKSAKNTSDSPRPIYTFHVMDQSGANFSKDNWIQPSASLPFTPIYETLLTELSKQK